MCKEEKVDNIKLSVPKIIVLALIPGLVILFWAILFSNPFLGINLSIMLSLMLAILLGLIPTQLGILKYFAMKNKVKIKDVILFREKISIKRYLLSIFIPLLIAGLIFVILPKFELILWGKTFDFIPDWFKVYRFNIDGADYLTLTIVLVFLLNGIFGPFVEELYFRGFLLPRMKMFGNFAPLINTVLFSIYHFFTPWENITRILAVTPLAYSVWFNKNINVGIIIHCSLNTFGNIGLLMAILG